MDKLRLHSNALGFEIHSGQRLAALYRASEELARDESPKPCFAPIYTPRSERDWPFRRIHSR